MAYPFLKLVGGALLFYVATKLVTEDADGDDDGVEGAQTLWRAVRIVAIADIVMSLDNVIAIAATARDRRSPGGCRSMLPVSRRR